MENLGRPHRTRQALWERGMTSDKAGNWRFQDQGRGHSFKSDTGTQKKNSQGGPYRPSPKRGGLGPLSCSPGGVRPGHSPSQWDDLQWFSSPENIGGSREETWREHSQQWRRRNNQDDEQMDDRDKELDVTPQKSGKRWRNQNKRKPFDEENKGPPSDELTLSAKELHSLKQAEKRLNRDEVYSLKKRPHNNASAAYICCLCDVNLESIPEAYRHIRDKRHKKRLREKQEEIMLTEIQPPGQEQITAVTNALETVVRGHGMDDQDVEQRRSVVQTMQGLFLSTHPEIKLRLYGSSATKFGFKDSDVNIDIQYPPHMHQPDVLLLVKDILSRSPLFIDLEADFHARVPVVVCKEEKSGLICKVSAGNDCAFHTTMYLAALSSRESLILPLVVGLRRWAQICQMDRAEEGGLPPYTFALMVIYFLQQRRQPLLPTYLTHEIRTFSLSKLSDFTLTHVEDDYIHWAYIPTSKDASKAAESCRGKSPLVMQTSCVADVGHLWVEMLRFYALEYNMADNVISVRTRALLSREIKDWPKKRIAVEDPFAVKRNVARTVNSPQMYDYIVHCFKTTYKYFALPLNTQGANHKPQAHHGLRQGGNSKVLDEERACLSGVGQLSLLSGSTSQTNVDENGPEDSDCIIEEEVYIDSDSGDEKEKEKVDVGKSSPSEDEEDEEEEADDEDLDADVDTDTRPHLDSVTTEDEELFLVEEISGEEILSDEEGPDLDTPASMDEDEERVDSVHTSISQAVTGEVAKDENLVPSQKPSSLSYEFTRQAFTRGKSHTVVCSLCKRDGHLKKGCPEDFKKVQLPPLPPMTPQFLSVLNQVCEQCYTDFTPDKVEVDVRGHILQDVETFVRWHFPDARLQLFGSSKNGFGFRKSDLDICMVLEGKDTLDDADCIAIIEKLARLLKKHTGLKNILPITTAKVPIVKFCHIRTGLEGDISLYNTLALHNTHLLASYAAIDRRVKILCYVMKVFAKMCDIGDASRGSLSSYAYTLMVLFFLQQRNPPVVPVLQEIYDGKVKPEILVDGWNVYFFDDLKSLPCRWPHFGANTETVGELWLGLLRFYTEDFDFREHVICIRQHARLTTFNKQWTSKYIVIEDPFDLNHNLGAGLSRKMTNFIMKALINGRTVFGTPIKEYPPEYPSQMEYFFDPEVLTEGEVAPNDRCCRICGKIGHFMKDCPVRKRYKPRRSENREKVGADDENTEQCRQRPDQWWKNSDKEKRCCYLCGSTAHIKRDCQQYRSPAGHVRMESPATTSGHFRILKEKEKQGASVQEEKKKRKQQNVILGPQAGSLSCRHMNRSSHRKSPVE